MGEGTEVQSFRDLIVWRRAIQLSVALYEYTCGFPSDELYGLRSQLRRAGVSIASNIAEGTGRRSSGEFIQFLGIARGSNYEVQTQLVIAKELRFGTEGLRLKCEGFCDEIERMLNSLMLSVERKKQTK